jgi:2-dehydropantoate 2-reductase
MKIAIIGAGAIGSVLGGLMARAGVDVTLIGRQSQVSAIHRNGLAIDGALGSFVIRVPAHEKLDFVPDLAILAVKTQNIAEALRENQFYIQAAPVMTLQNGARADQMVADIIGGERLYSGVVLFGATWSRVRLPTPPRGGLSLASRLAIRTQRPCGKSRKHWVKRCPPAPRPPSRARTGPSS